MNYGFPFDEEELDKLYLANNWNSLYQSIKELKHEFHKLRRKNLEEFLVFEHRLKDLFIYSEIFNVSLYKYFPKLYIENR